MAPIATIPAAVAAPEAPVDPTANVILFKIKIQEEEDNYAMSIDKDKDKDKDPNIPEELEYSDEDKSRHDSYYHERDFSSRGKRWTSFLKRGGGKKKASSASEPCK
eukprot:scaffold143690_cov76-Cyclotella_meneghiniana.AAC.3